MSEERTRRKHTGEAGNKGKFSGHTSQEASGVDLLEPPAPAETAAVEAPARAFDAPEAFTTRYDSVDDKVAAFKAELDTAVADLANDEQWIRYIDTMSRFHRYSPTNVLLIDLQTNGRATHVAGFRKWQEVDRQVRKGEKAIGILAPKIINKTKTDTAGNPVKGADGKPVKERRLVGFTTASVFDIAQTEGEDLPELDTRLSDEPPEGFIADMEAAATEAGWSVRYKELNSLDGPGRPQGWSQPGDKTIVVDSTMPPGNVAATLAHELGHVYAGHCEPDQAGHYHVGPGGCRGQMETEAESVAYVLCRSNGMDKSTAKMSAPYVRGWSKGDPAVLRASAENTGKAAKAILGAVPFRNDAYAE